MAQKHQIRVSRGAETSVRIRGIDLFCGAGGLTCGLAKAGVDVRAGFDLDPACRYAYESNNSAAFFESDVGKLSGQDLLPLFGPHGLKLLAGCAPCQPFSSYSQGKDPRSTSDWRMLLQFGRLVGETDPDFVTMENVPQLEDSEIFAEFIQMLSKYHIWYGVVDCVDYGIPQQRRRLVLLGSKLGPISLLEASAFKSRRTTVRSAIGSMPALRAGEANSRDPIHAAAGLSDLNLKRIRASRPGGSWRDWPKSLRAACHEKESGAGYGAVYGRMEWSRPSPTMTTLCHGFGNGRFGHPTQDRAISLREAAILQSFPKRYKFVPPGAKVRFTSVGRLIGNAVPPRLGEVIGRSLIRHATSVTQEKC